MDIGFKKRLIAIIMVGILMIFSPSSHADSYSYTTLTQIGASSPIYAESINDNGEVAGVIGVDRFGNPYGQAFIYNGSTYQAVSGGVSNFAINNNGQETGSGYAGISSQNITGFISNGSTSSIVNDPSAFYAPTYSLGPTYSLSINDSGVVVGYYQSNGISQGFMYDGSTYTSIAAPIYDGHFSSTDVATGINDSGEIVGYFANPTGIYGFLYNPANVNPQLPFSGDIVLNDPNATSGTWATGISNTGEVSGYYVDATGTHGFIYNGSTYTTIDDPNAVTRTVNIINPNIGGTTVTVTGGTMVTDINSSGQIIGQYTDSTGITQSFIASPAAVPVPSAIWLFGSVLAGFIGFNRRKTT